MKENPLFSDKMLLELARDSREKAWAPYSNFTVGAACIGGSGKSYFGCNVENSSYPVGICAERAAIAGAIAHGETKILSLALAGGPRDTLPSHVIRPCGMCLQFMSEFMGQGALILIADGLEKHIEFTMGDLLPQAFKLNNETEKKISE
jgi:cytidine deaminase